MSTESSVLVVKETTPGLVFLKGENSAVLVPNLPVYNPIVISLKTNNESTIVVKEAAAGLVFIKENDSAVLVPKLPAYNPLVIPKESTPYVIPVNIGATGLEGAEGPLGPTGEKGARGEKGEQGPTGGYYKFVQGSASEVWEIKHSLNKYPSITVQDSANENVEGSVDYINANEIILSFSAAFSGTAFLN